MSIIVGVVIIWRPEESRMGPFNHLIKWYQENMPTAKIYLVDSPQNDWNPAAARNAGVKQAEQDGCDVVIVNDADTIPEKAPLEQAVMGAFEDGYIHNPYTKYFVLDKLNTKMFIGGKKITQCEKTEYKKALSGVLVSTPATWWELGGQDEKFSGWGFEDTAFAWIHQVVKGSFYKRHEGSVFALSHDRMSLRTESFIRNKKIWYQFYKNNRNKEFLLKFVKKKLNEL